MENKGSFANPELDANLGGGVLRRFTVTFDYDARRMYLVPNAAVNAPDPFDRSGMWINQLPGALAVVSVAPGSAAAAAGLADGDRITAIGAERVAKHTVGV